MFFYWGEWVCGVFSRDVVTWILYFWGLQKGEEVVKKVFTGIAGDCKNFQTTLPKT